MRIARGRYTGYIAASWAVRAVIFNDAGVGFERAGIRSLPYLEELGIAAATASHLSCRIGDAADMNKRGVISHVNAVAKALGVQEGMPCSEAAELLKQAVHVTVSLPEQGETRKHITVSEGQRPIVLLDSASLIDPQDDNGKIIVTGSHGGLVGDNLAMALQADGFAAVFNDVGVGIDNAGVTRLPVLDERRIPAVTVATSSARIGEAMSIYHDGIISTVNKTAAAMGAQVGTPLRPLLENWARLP